MKRDNCLVYHPESVMIVFLLDIDEIPPRSIAQGVWGYYPSLHSEIAKDRYNILFIYFMLNLLTNFLNSFFMILHCHEENFSHPISQVHSFTIFHALKSASLQSHGQCLCPTPGGGWIRSLSLCLHSPSWRHAPPKVQELLLV